MATSSPPQQRRRARPALGFSLIEVMVALAIGSSVMLGAIGLVTTAIGDARAQGGAYDCMSIAQQKIELLSSVPLTSPLLTDEEMGSASDPDPTTGVDGPAATERVVNALGDPEAGAPYTVYWKIENAFLTTREVRVYCLYPGRPGEDVVSLTTIR